MNSLTTSAAAARYAEIRTADRVRERLLIPGQREPGELELQARWFAGDWGRRFRTTDNQELEIVQWGVWNREPGPDFSDAAIRLDGAPAVRGSIEFDLADRNWETHGHATNSAFEPTVLHVFVHAGTRRFFTRTLGHRNVPQLRLDLAQLPHLPSANVPLAHAGRCHAPLRGLPEPRIRGIVEAAAQFRLARKTARLAHLIADHGRDEALFQETSAALGYKENKWPFTLLAQRLPLRFLRTHLADAEALLFGTAAFLAEADLAAYKQPTRAYVRALWDRWWPHRDSVARLILPAGLWRFSGARPLNHPQRRLAALAIIAGRWPAYLNSLGTAEPKTIQEFFGNLHHPFWDTHYTLLSAPAAKEMALVGPSRIADLMANVLFPYWGTEGGDVWPRYAQLPSRLGNRRVETAAARLFADDPRRAAFLKRIAHQQGLLQIYEDFCLQDNSDCAECPFPEQMLKWK